MGVPRAVSFYGLLSGPPSNPKVNIFDESNFPHWVSTPFLLQLIAVHGYYRTYGSGHSRLALRADFQV